ncbi:hypothetical protein G6O69_15690 [Pseudenhygromyxa sp. WMMC2535]|uniref:hypothetical protein n=1 Tax=Pseudenhygromyxa sp. WMMC2535 TaxID=2712867 RepID=UPI001555C7E2|nr:hypothetical protein [Pseudenhygromyxa sp. WMMC2535]NVB39286.1 hypothetical protein [Pseudenhygromyxa sp. WMMC2535]
MTTSYSPRKFQRIYDLDLIIASRANMAVGDMVWDAAGIIPPRLDRPGAPRNVFNALEVMEEISADERHRLQAVAEATPLGSGDMANISMHVEAHHAGGFEYPAITEVTTKIELDKLSAFNFSNIQVRAMSNDLRVRIDRLLNGVKNNQWGKYDMTIRRSFIITELYYGSISVCLDTKLAVAADVEVLTGAGFTLSGDDSVNRVETYTMDMPQVPFAMRLEMTKRFAS